ncbi:SDR family oxidoreductase [Leptospira interrogans]|uniref:dTDP-4-dehydrorhamnose reductase n=6 Tax=Leptospira TaxID=171 RepID=A0A0E2D8X8_LEPIR|nr:MULTISPECIES: SDR family oxidoreductase [Leptospira]ADC93942.1 dTDP-4-dehydrorhamnose reductase [Leptospira interrogans serovar Autumnalis]ADC94025.1 dTDP-4-dehydrorhamnose reductase [Leptospira interrogans serovar Grippotyphosa]KAA1266718.1 SDR family NAD(P)-dependent oxidoreductase [Leptospira interrogans serovar Weerasinghe]AJR14906.1 dTDP-4-dehydrorhamnose reductase [Leptospira interrogans serovar Linhai str. 56609]EJO77043.1 putative dTDP-4-dehydrorhamnose reductase [Leptospira interro
MDSNTILITGASGLLGHHLSRFFLENGNKVIALRKTHSLGIIGLDEIEIDLLDFNTVKNLLTKIGPDYIIHCAGLTNVDDCEKNESLAKKIHIDVSQIIAQTASRINSKMIHISTDHLWDGTMQMVTEDVPVCPLNVYGKTKAESERAVLAVNSEALILRTNFFGPGLQWRQSLSDWIINSLNRNEKINAFSDVFFTPISIYHLARVILFLIQKKAKGIYHTVGSERISKYDFAISIAKSFNKSTELIRPISIQNIQFNALRPLDMSLSTDKIVGFLNVSMPTVQAGIDSLSGEFR